MSPGSLGLLIAILIQLFIAVGMAMHADLCDRNPYLWGFLGLILGIWGLVVYIAFLLFIGEQR